MKKNDLIKELESLTNCNKSHYALENKGYNTGVLDAIQVIKTHFIEDVFEVSDNEDLDELEPCSICGDINGMVNPCCVGYDDLHFNNCGYG